MVSCSRSPRGVIVPSSRLVLSRRQTLLVLGGSPLAVLAPVGCGGGAGDTPEHRGGSASDAGYDTLTATSCDDSGSGAVSCSTAPAGRNVGQPCDFARFRIQPAPGVDMFDSALIGRDELGYYARSAICTHQGCNLASLDAVIPEGVACPCHGSIFDNHGVVFPDQPAKLDLRPVAVALGCDGGLYVDLATTVSPDFRLPLP